MSAWIVTTDHIDALAHAATRDKTMTYLCQGRIVEATHPNRVGRALVRANIDCVEALNPDIEAFKDLPGFPTVVSSGYQFRTPSRQFSVVELLKLLDCFEYQSRERDAWEETEAFGVCTALRAHLIQQLPGYAEAAWTIGEMPTKRPAS